MNTYFGFALADSMFVGNVIISRMVISPEQAREIVSVGIISCLNPSHEATIRAMRSRYGIDVEIPEKPIQVQLNLLDSMIVMGVRGLPRLTNRHEYSQDEIDKATFTFSIYTVCE